MSVLVRGSCSGIPAWYAEVASWSALSFPEMQLWLGVQTIYSPCPPTKVTSVFF